ncbi:MAG: hypothetical protein ACODAD_05420, partial [Planctomycetota bacterium]
RRPPNESHHRRWTRRRGHARNQTRHGGNQGKLIMAKKKTSPVWKLLAVAVVISFCGCAAAYHDYQGSRTRYLYCPPPPLPYVAYQDRHCPTPGAANSFHGRKSTLEGETSPAREAR